MFQRSVNWRRLFSSVRGPCPAHRREPSASKSASPRRIRDSVLNVNGNNTPQEDPGAADLRRVSAELECDRRLSHGGSSGPASAEWRYVQPPILIHAGDQRDRPRRHQADKQFVGLAGRTTFQIKINRLELTLRFDGSCFNRQGKFSQFCWDFYLSPRKFTLVNLSFLIFRITC